ncbi:hypothetical protein [Rhizobium mayense]|uniref:hypothetical protein n=1 Tax=Rhizobium mayense TaxID=1312184 RepID=UPI00398C426B
MMSYSSNARLLAGDPAFSVIDIPDEFQPLIEYGMAIRKGADDETRSLRNFLLSETGRKFQQGRVFSGRLVSKADGGHGLFKYQPVGGLLERA